MNAVKEVVVLLTKPLITPSNEGLRTYQPGETYTCKIDKAYQLVKNGEATFDAGFEVLAELYFQYIADIHQEMKNKDSIDSLKHELGRIEDKLMLQKNALEHCVNDLRACKWIIFALTAAITVYTSYLVSSHWLSGTP